MESGATLLLSTSSVTGGRSALHVKDATSSALVSGSNLTGNQYGVLAESGGAVTLTGGSVNGNFTALYASGAGSSITATDTVATGTTNGSYATLGASVSLLRGEFGSSGTNGFGLFAFNNGASLIATDVNVIRSGAGGGAVESNTLSAVSLTRGYFETTNVNALGLSALGSDSHLTANGSIVTTRGSGAIGVNVNGSLSDVIKAKIELTDVAITTSGADAYGARADNQTSLAMTGGSIVTTGVNATGGGSFGTLVIARSVGVFHDVSITSSGSGVAAQFGGDITLQSTSVTTNGTNAHGLFSAGVSGGVYGAAIHATDSTIQTLGATSHGVAVYGGTSVDLKDSSVVTQGSGSAAIYGTLVDYVLPGVVTANNTSLVSNSGQGIYANGATMNVLLENHSSLSSLAGDVLDARARIISGSTFVGHINLIADDSDILGGAAMEVGTTSNVTLRNNSNWVMTGSVNLTQLSLDQGTIRYGASVPVSASAGIHLENGGGTVDTGTFVGSISSQVTGAGSLIKTGAGVLALSGTNNYSGTTAVNNGTLLVDGDSSAVSAMATVAVGATFGGSGAFGGTVDVFGSFSPGGTPTIGMELESLSVGSLNFHESSTFVFQLDSSSLNADLAVASMGLNINNLALLDLSDLSTATVALGTKLTLINYGGLWDSGTFSGYLDDSIFMLGANSWLINYNDDIGGG